MSNLPKAGVQLVAENFSAFLSTMGQANKSVTDFAADAGNSMARVNTAVNGVQTAGAVGQIDDMGRAMDRQHAPASRFDQILSGAFMNIGMAITGKLMQGFSAVSGWLLSAPQHAASFADKMNRYFAVADKAAADMGTEVESLILKLGQELPVSANDVADAAIELAKGGLTAATLQAGALKDTINFATASNLGLAEASNIVIKQMGTFTAVGASASDQASFMATSMDLLTKAANTSSVDVGELAHGLLQAGGTAKAVGVDYKDFVMIMGALSPAFSSSSEAGTSFKNFLLRLQPTSDKAYEQMADLGLISRDTTKMLNYLSSVGLKPAGDDVSTLSQQIAGYLKNTQGLKNKDIEKFFKFELSTNTLYDANGQLKSMAEVSGILATATAGLTDQQKSLAFATIFGNDAMGAAVQLASLGKNGVEAFSKQMDGANGVQEMYAATAKGAELAASNFEGTMDTLQTSIGTHFLPLMEQSYNLGNSVASVFLNISQALRGDTEAMKKLGPSGKAVLTFLQDSITTYNELKTSFTGWWTTQTSTTGGLTQTYNAVSSSAQKLVGFLASLGQYLTPLTQEWAYLDTTLRQIATEAMPMLNDFMSIFGSNLNGESQLITSVFATAVDIIAFSIRYIVQTVGNGVLSIIRIWNEISPVVVPLLKYIYNNASAIFSSLLEVGRLALAGLRAVFTGDTTALVEAWQSFGTRMTEIWSTWLNTTINIFAPIAQDLAKRFNAFINELPQMILRAAYNAGVYVAQTRNNIVQGFTEAWDTATYVFKNAWPMMLGALSSFPSNMTNWIKSTWTFVERQFNNLWRWDNVGKNMTDGFIKGIFDNIGKVWSAMVAFATKVLEAFNAGVESQSPSRAFMRAAKNVTDGFIVGIDKQDSKVYDAISKLATGVVYTANGSIDKARVVNNYYNTSSQTAYNLGVTTAASAPDVVANFNLLQVMT
jgi:phage-related protein